jgi:hypothetical protein
MITKIYLTALLVVTNAHAFNDISSGLQTLKDNHLKPILTTGAATSLILYVILSYFNADKYKDKIGTVFGLTIIGLVAQAIIDGLAASFN